MEEIAKAARQASAELGALPGTTRCRAVQLYKEELIKAKALILEANKTDLAKAGASEAKLKRLSLTEPKFNSLIEGIDTVIELPDPVGKVTLKRELSPGLILERVTSPIGVLLTIYEARPEAGVQIASLALKSGNALILKGGKEAVTSNQAIFRALQAALVRAHAEVGVPKEALQLVETHEQVQELLKMSKYIDLVIPRGSNELVRTVQANTKIPVLGHADGICMIYVDHEVADEKKAVGVVVDSKTNYPAACNAVETLIVHESKLKSFLPSLVTSLKVPTMKFRADERAMEHLPAKISTLATDEDWENEYLGHTMNIKTVDSVEEAISFINLHGSGHTDCILSNDEANIKAFRERVDSAGVYVNCSTRFADGFRYGFGAEVGISTNRIHSRGPVGLDGLVLYKYYLTGDGHQVGEMGQRRLYTHIDLPLNA